MTRSAIERYLQVVLHEGGAATAERCGPTVAISRDYGAGAREIAPMLAERIGVPFYDKQIIDGIVQRVEGDADLMHRLDEAATPGLIARVMHAFGGIPSADEYARALVEVVISIARCGGVILGRGAHLISSAPDMYRVYLRASPETCIARIAERKDLDPESARREWRRIEEARRTFLKRLYGHERDEFGDFDLIVNTDCVRRAEGVVDIVVGGLHACGLLGEKT
ncbi:cytidylate kinase-like family protein [Acidihalobacter prosperus]